MTALHMIIFFLDLACIAILLPVAVAKARGLFRYLVVFMIFFMVFSGMLVLLEGHATAECKELGWQGGRWEILDNEAVCIEITTVKVSLDQLKTSGN